MPKKIDPEVQARAVRLVTDHLGEYSSLTEASTAVAKQVGVGRETVRRWVRQAQVDGGRRDGVTSEELVEIKTLKSKVRRLEEDNAVLKAATVFFVGELDPPQPLIMGFIDTMRAEGHAVESTCRVLREQGCQVATRTYRAWRANAPAARTISDAHVVDTVRGIAWNVDAASNRKLAAEGLYGRRKMTALLRRTSMPGVSAGSVDRAMRTLGLSGARRDKGIRTTIPAKDGKRAGDLLDRVFSTGAPNHVWVTDFTYSAQSVVMCSSVGRPRRGW